MTHAQKRQSAKIAAIARELCRGRIPGRIEYAINTGHCGRWLEAVEPHEIRAAMRRENPYEGGTVAAAYEKEAAKQARELRLEAEAMAALIEREDRENQAALAAGLEI